MIPNRDFRIIPSIGIYYEPEPARTTYYHQPTPSSVAGQQQQKQEKKKKDQKEDTVIPIVQHPPQSLPQNQPSLDLFEGPREEYIKFGLPLYEAAIKGDWKTAKHILEQKPELKSCAITENYETLLHVAASAQSTKAEDFVKNLVQLLEEKDLELQSQFLDTALSLTAISGSVKTAETMVAKNPNLINIPNKSRLLPLNMAAFFAKSAMVRYLYGISNKMTGEYWSDDNRGRVLLNCVEAGIFDICIKIVEDRPELIVKKDLLTNVLLALAQKTDALNGTKPSRVFKVINSLLRFKLGTYEEERIAVKFLTTIWGIIAKLPVKEIDEITWGRAVKVEKENEITGSISKTEKKNEIERFHYPSRVPFVAVKMGNTRYIVELIRLYPDLAWKRDDKGKTIFHLAIKRRQIKIYKLLYEIGSMNNIILITHAEDMHGNNMLHMVGKSAKQSRFQDVSGVAFQMQRELLWFEEVKKMIPPNYKDRKNKDGKTPQDLFSEKHAELLKAGETWMKDTASQCMVVATLITTVVFAAAFTLPGGYNQDTGIPFFRKEPSLIIFVIADAFSLIFSSTSVLIFLSILTSRYAERDFLEALPKKLVNGLATLFLSIISMMIAFSASFFALYDKKVKWVSFTVTGLCSIPVILYGLLQYRLLKDVFNSAYRSGSLFKPSNKRVLYP